MDLFDALGQMDSAARSATGAVSRSGSGAPGSPGTLIELEARIDRLNLLVQTLLRVLLEKGVLQEEEFKNWMDYVDKFDGARDGRLHPDHSPSICPSCGRKSPAAAPRCLFCGVDLPTEFLARDRSKDPK